MKKGLLSLLAAALTIVSCQNYDDQFAELTGLVNTLSAEVAGIAQVKTDLGTLSNTVSGLATAASVAGISSGQDDLDLALASAQATIDALTLALDDVASATELAEINDALAAVQADVTEILSKNAVINQTVTINNEATLIYAETLISSATDAPNVIINGGLVISVTTTNFDAAMLARVDAITPKVATVLGVAGVSIANTSTPVHTVLVPNLTFIDGPYTVSGAPADDSGLRTISGKLTISHTGAADYSQITTIGGDVEINKDVTSIDLSAATVAGGVYSSGSSVGTITFAKATAVNIGTSKVQNVDLAKAVGTVNLGHAGKITGDVVISAPLATRVDFGAKSITGSLTVTTKAALTAFYAPALTSAGTSTVSAKEAHFAKLTGFGGNSSISAAAVDFSSLSQTASGTLILPTATAFSAPKLTVTGNVTATAAETVEVKNSSNVNLALPAAKTLTINALGTTTDFETAGYASLVTFNVAGAQGKAPFITTVTNTLLIENASVLKTVNITGGDIDVVTIDGTAITALSTAGEIRSFRLEDNDSLAAATFGHAHIEGSGAADFTIHDNAKLAAVVTTALDETGNIDISLNAKLASIDLSSLTTIPLAGTYTITIEDNALTGGFVAATAGATTTAFVEAQIKSNDLLTLKPYITLAVASRAEAAGATPIGDVTYNLDINIKKVAGTTAAPIDLDTKLGTVIGASIARTGIVTDTLFNTLVVAE